MNTYTKAILVMLLAFALCLAPAGETARAEQPIMQVHQIFNACADAYLIRCGGINIIIDAGNDSGNNGSALMDYLRQAGVSPLTAYIATHYHDDHSANINRILEEFGNENTLVYGPSEVVRPLYDPLAAGEYRQLKDNDVVRFGEITLKCVGPAEVRHNGLTNQDSLNFLIIYGQRRFLFTGDFVRGDHIMANHREEIAEVDVLKFPHHGLQPFCIDPGVLRHIHPSILLIPTSEPGAALSYARQNGFTGDMYSNGSGNAVILTDGFYLEVVENVQPGQFAND